MNAILLLIVRRALISVVILFFVAALLFCVLRLLPVDPAAMSLPPMATIAEVEAKRREMGLDLPLPQQFLIWLGQVLHGDFGTSIHFRRSVASLVASTLPATVELAVIAMAIATALGLGGGLLLFHVRGRAAEPAIDFGSIVLLSNYRIPVGSVLYSAVRRRARRAAVYRAPIAGIPAPGGDRVPADRHAPDRATGHVLGRAQAHDPAGVRARDRVFADDHAGAALEA